jgi:hypothetical protein
MVPIARPSTEGPGLDGERRQLGASEVAGAAGHTTLDRPCPMVALQFGYALGVKRHRILHSSVLN